MQNVKKPKPQGTATGKAPAPGKVPPPKDVGAITPDSILSVLEEKYFKLPEYVAIPKPKPFEWKIEPMDFAELEKKAIYHAKPLVKHSAIIFDGIPMTPKKSKHAHKLPLSPISGAASVIRTQKAQGVNVLLRWAGRYDMSTPKTVLIQDGRGIKAGIEHMGYPGRWDDDERPDKLIARPCPMEGGPRHGFEESRVCTSPDDIKATWKATKKADPKGEMLLQPFIDSRCSAVITPNTLAFGAGNDAATAGRNAWTLLLPPGQFSLSDDKSVLRDGYHKQVLKDAGVSPEHAPYLECVIRDRTDNGYSYIEPFLVQLRAGVPGAAVHDFVPTETYKVESIRVLTSEDNPDLAWEAEAKKLPPGTAVWHEGGTVASHFAMHCRINGLAYITSHEPHVGEVLRMECERPPTYTEEIRRGILHGLYHTVDLHTDDPGAWETRPRAMQILALGMFGLHNYGADQSEHGSYVLGFGAALVWRLLAMACVGEFRHFGDTQINYSHIDRFADPRFRCAECHKNRTECPHGENDPASIYDPEWRHRVYADSWGQNPELLAGRAAYATEGFLRHCWTTGYGGLEWGRCGLAALRLYNALTFAVNRPTIRNTAHLLSVAHRALNMAHNGGWVFNKFQAGKSLMDRAAKSERCQLIRVVLKPLDDVRRLHALSTPSVKLGQRGWRKLVDRDLRNYADEPTNLKRAIWFNGSVAEYAAFKQEYPNAASTWADALNGFRIAMQRLWWLKDRPQPNYEPLDLFGYCPVQPDFPNYRPGCQCGDCRSDARALQSRGVFNWHVSDYANMIEGMPFRSIAPFHVGSPRPDYGNDDSAPSEEEEELQASTDEHGVPFIAEPSMVWADVDFTKLHSFQVRPALNNNFLLFQARCAENPEAYVYFYVNKFMFSGKPDLMTTLPLTSASYEPGDARMFTPLLIQPSTLYKAMNADDKCSVFYFEVAAISLDCWSQDYLWQVELPKSGVHNGLLE